MNIEGTNCEAGFNPARCVSAPKTAQNIKDYFDGNNYLEWK